MNMLDLFSGIGGFAVSAKWALGKKVNVVGFCEIDEFCQTILKKHFPKVPIYDDVKIVNNKIIKRKIDIITGGFPCQDISLAGKGKGIEGERSGLWKEMYRIIGEFRPRWAIIENVSALTSRGLTVVLNDLAKAGYDAEWQCISAREVGARHKRERIWVVAYPSSLRLQCKKNDLVSQVAEMEYKSKRTAYLNPQWVEWLMGYPIGYTNPTSQESKKKDLQEKKESIL